MIKRLFDITAASLALVLLSPLMALTMLLIILDEPGSPIYKSTRVGRNMKKFTFYKFRSMRVKADAELNRLICNNLYTFSYAEDENLSLPEELHSVRLYGDNYCVSEYDYLTENAKLKNSCFVKIAKDPRITWFGSFIRKTSIDELPQLVNIIKGDMSIVGNRPLSVGEAEMLTNDEYGKRFDCPAGLTGLWQIQPDKDSMPCEKRRQLDIEYAGKASIGLDIKIILGTFRKVFSRSNV